MLGPDTVIIDRFIRLIGLTRATDEYMKNIKQEDSDMLENYAAGINKVVENIKVYPPEFQFTWNSFAPWTPQDSVSIEFFYVFALSTDWYVELLRERLLEIYDKDLVDKLLPF